VTGLLSKCLGAAASYVSDVSDVSDVSLVSDVSVVSDVSLVFVALHLLRL